MRKSRYRHTQDAAVDMTPMLDIVFIMLIFFIVTASFLHETGLDVTRPQDADHEDVKPAPPILIQINAENHIYIDRRQIDRRSVRANIERKRAEQTGAAVIVQADRKARTGVLVDVMDQARQAKAPVSVAPLQNTVITGQGAGG